MNENPLACSCGVQAFRNIEFPEPGVMTAVCFHCGQTWAISLSAIAAEQAWEKMEREAPEPLRTGGYKYGGML